MIDRQLIDDTIVAIDRLMAELTSQPPAHQCTIDSVTCAILHDAPILVSNLQSLARNLDRQPNQEQHYHMNTYTRANPPIRFNVASMNVDRLAALLIAYEYADTSAEARNLAGRMQAAARKGALLWTSRHIVSTLLDDSFELPRPGR